MNLEARKQRGKRIAKQMYSEWSDRALKLYDHRGSAHLRGEEEPSNLELLGTNGHLLFQMALQSHFGISIPAEGVTPLLSRALTFELEYFHGNWRLHHDITAEELRSELEWLTAFRAGLMAAFLLGDIKSASQLAMYPDLDCIVEDFTNTKKDQQLGIAIAYEISGRDWTAKQSLIPARMGRLQKLLANCLLPLHERDSEAFGTAMVQYLGCFNRTEPEWFIDKVVSIDASILWNFASLQGIELPRLEQAQSDVLVTPESLGVESTTVD